MISLPESEIQASPSSKSPCKAESAAFYIFLATAIAAPLAFVPTTFVALELVKTAVIALGTLISLFLYAYAAFKQRKAILPPKSILWTSALIGASLILSSLASIQPSKSFFGQGFELSTGSFLIVLFLSAGAAFFAVQKRVERAMLLYVGMAVSFAVLYIFQALRFLFGPGFASVTILSSLTSTIFGNWYSLGIYSMLIAILCACAALLMPLSRRFKAMYWVLAALAALAAAVIDSGPSWIAATAVFAFIAAWISFSRPSAAGSGARKFLKQVAWIPLAITILAGIFAWKGAYIAAPVISKLNAGYSELSLPWQMTLDVVAGSVKNYPMLGVGPNHFTQAYLAYKPSVINTTDAWGAEFNNGFALIPSFIATQGLMGTAAWLLFFIFLGILIVQALKRLPEDSQVRFAVVSSSMGSAFLWLASMLYVPSHVLLFFAFVMTGIFLGSAVAHGLLKPVAYAPQAGSRSYKVMPSVLVVCMLLCVAMAFFYAKKTAGLAYFGAGVKQLSVANDPASADADFQKALMYDHSDLYLQARAEAGLAKAKALAQTVSSASSASTTQTVAKQVMQILSQSADFARSAASYDPSNYYNYVSEARVSEFAAGINVSGAYDSAVQAYTAAIGHDPQNPSLYLSLAQLQVSQKKYDEAVQTVGAALQVKPNYLEGVFLLSQIEAAQGNLKDAITAAQFAVQINSQQPTLYFQLGLLEYQNQDYVSSAKAFEAAVALQPDYANARYFLGLSYVRLARNADAIVQFQELAKGNPDNQEVALILTNLQAGKSPFVNEQQPVTPPEKRATLPIKAKPARGSIR